MLRVGQVQMSIFMFLVAGDGVRKLWISRQARQMVHWIDLGIFFNRINFPETPFFSLASPINLIFLVRATSSYR